MRHLPLLFLTTLSVACKGEGEVDVGTDADGDRYLDREDCDDTNPDAHPGGTEVCDFVDNDCNGEVDEGLSGTLYADADGDGYGDPASTVPTCGEPVEGYVEDASDCDDTRADLNPEGVEACDDLDNDCDGRVDWGLRVPADYEKIRKALANAEKGETVCVSPGTYVENIDFAGAAVTLVGVGGAEVTTIDGGGNGPTVSFDTREGPDTILRGFTITGGSDPVGAGITIRSADPTLEDLIVTGNSCTTAETSCTGTGIYAQDSNFTLTNSVVSNNTQASSYPYYPYNYGAGIYLDRSSPTITDVDVLDNSSTFAGYYGVSYGAGIYANSSTPTVDGLLLAGNLAEGTATYAYAYGGGAMLYASGGTWDHVTIADNRASAYVARGGGLYLGEYSTGTFANLVIAHNTVGGEDSTSAAGGGVFATYASTKLVNADIVGNSSEGASGYGGGLYLQYYSTLVVANVSVWGNEASGEASGGAAVAYDATYPPSTIKFSYCNFSGNGEDPFYGLGTPVGEFGNISVDPRYKDTSSELGQDWDLTLGAGSGLTDAGDPSVLDSDGSTSDIGSQGGPRGR